jgi:hypothetical protein
MKGALEMEPLSLKGSVEGASGEAPSLGTLEDMLRKSPDMGISLQRGPFPSEGDLVCGAYIGDFDR